MRCAVLCRAVVRVGCVVCWVIRSLLVGSVSRLEATDNVDNDDNDDTINNNNDSLSFSQEFTEHSHVSSFIHSNMHACMHELGKSKQTVTPTGGGSFIERYQPSWSKGCFNPHNPDENSFEITPVGSATYWWPSTSAASVNNQPTQKTPTNNSNNNNNKDHGE